MPEVQGEVLRFFFLQTIRYALPRGCFISSRDEWNRDKSRKLALLLAEPSFTFLLCRVIDADAVARENMASGWWDSFPLRLDLMID